MSDFFNPLGVVDIGFDLVNTFLNGINTIEDNRIKRETHLHNMRLSQEQWDWSRQEAKLQKDREDSAYQRKVVDLMKAGLNPVLAAGGSGASSSAGSVGGSQVSAPTLSKYEKLQSLLSTAQSSATLKHTENAINLQKQELQNLKEDYNLKITTQLKLLEEIKNSQAKTAGILIDNEGKRYELDKTKKTGISKGASMFELFSREALNALYNAVDFVDNSFVSPTIKGTKNLINKYKPNKTNKKIDVYSALRAFDKYMY